MLQIQTVLVTLAFGPLIARAVHSWDLTENINCGKCAKLDIGPNQKTYQSIGPVAFDGKGKVHDGYMPVMSNVYTYPDKIILGGDQEDAFEAGDVIAIRDNSGASANVAGPLNITSVEVKTSTYGTQTWVYFAGPKNLQYLEEKWLFRKSEEAPVASTTTAAPPGSGASDKDDTGAKTSGPDIDGGGWIHVRHVPAGNHWHPAKDELVGWEVYGSPDNSNSAWSIKFPLHFKEFLFATGDLSKWLIASKEAVTGSFYSNAPRVITKSSKSSSSYVAKWHHRQSHREDPWISLVDHSAAVGSQQLLYGGNSYGGTHAKILANHKGADVYVRMASASEDEDIPPAACQETCDASSKCAGFVYLKNEKRCYFRSTTSCNRDKDNNRDCWAKIKNPDADAIDPDTANSTCQAGTCVGQKFFVFAVVSDEQKCGGMCLKSNLKGHQCTYYTYSSATKYCLLYSTCPTVEKAAQITVPEDVNLEVGDLSSYSTCKFTVFTTEKWLDMKGLASRQVSTHAGGSSARAIDSNMRSDWGGGSCTHTHRHQNPWWEVDFKEDTRIDSVRVLNRGDCCENRLGNFNVKVDGVLCGTGGAGKGQFGDVDCGIEGKTLRIESNLNEWFTICEVKVKQLEIADITNQTWFL